MTVKQHNLLAAFGLLSTAWLGATGCIVGQPPGKGQVFHLQEPTTGGRYYLYLPEGYDEANRGVSDKRWPLVVTFHGMRPFDDYGSQIREWQQEADRYGFVVLAPKTRMSDVLRQIAKVRPTRVNGTIRHDESTTLGALDDVTRRVNIDPTKVLSTSWSSGGYLAHYMANRHPERFTFIAPRQSNFSADILDESQVPKYRDTKVGIFYTENDFGICKRESQEGAQWYARHGFDVTFAVFRDLGHERRPSVAADFFARQIGAVAKTPPTELAKMQVKRVPLPKLNGKKNGQSKKPGKVVSVSQLTGKRRAAQREAERRERSKRSPPRPATQSRQSQPTQPPPTHTSPRQDRTIQRVENDPTAPQHFATNRRPSASPHTDAAPTHRFVADRNGPLRIRVSSTIGIAPHHVSFSALAAADLSRGAYFLWMDNGEPISNGINGQKYLTTPGKHVLELLMTTADGRQHYAKRTINVLERLGGKKAE